MRTVVAFSVVVAWVTFLGPATARCQESEEEGVVSGRVSVAGKYDTNVDLQSGDSAGDDADDEATEDAFITEISALLLWKPPVASSWSLGIEAYGVTDLHVEAMGDSWCIGRGNLSLAHAFGANTISLLNEGRYYSEPDDTEFDNFRNAASLVYTRAFSEFWQARTGYENLLHVYPESDFINYLANGGFVEVRNSWTQAFSTYYGYHFHYYQGTDDPGTDETPGSPEKSNRHTAEVGFESFFARKDSLAGAYTFQADDSSDEGVTQIGEIRGEDQNLEPDAEFNFLRHEIMLLYSHKFNEAFAISLYGELIHKTFPGPDDDEDGPDPGRTDVLLLTSLWMTARLHGEWYAKPRYLYRMNQSTLDSEDFQDHIVSIGFEHRF